MEIDNNLNSSTSKNRGETYALEDNTYLDMGIPEHLDGPTTFENEGRFVKATEQFQELGESVLSHVKANSTRYLSLAIGAVVVGGAFAIFQVLRSRRPARATVSRRAPARPARNTRNKSSRIH